MKLLLLVLLFAMFALSAYGQRTQTFRGYLCENIDTRQTFDHGNPNGQIGLTLGDDTKWFFFRVFGTPPQLTRSLNKANPRTDKIGTEYLVTYVKDEKGSLMAKTVKKTGRFKKVPTCLLGDPIRGA